jgi:glucose-1-phosphate thymidylyltransferase
MKVIIPVAGIGSRLRPHTHTQPKSLIPVAGKPILSHILDSLIQAGLNDFIFIIGYLGDQIENFITTNYPGVKSDFVIQTTGKGIGHAIWLAKDKISKNDEIFIVLGDTIFDTDLDKIISMPYSVLGVKKVQDPRRFGVAELNEKGVIVKLVEKPSIPKSNLALVGLYKIKQGEELMEALDYIIKNNLRTQNEFHLTDALMRMVELGTEIRTVDVDNWYDCGKKEILLETNSILLQRLKPKNDVTDFVNTIIIPPVFTGKNCKISNSIIGPNVSIGENAIISYSIIKESIIGPYSQLENAILQHSLIGNDASMKGMIQSLNLGDSAEVNFS